MRALLCPASLKGVLSATEAAAALASGVRAAGGEGLELPTADGGEGTADAMYATLGGTWQEAVVADPLGRRVPARWRSRYAWQRSAAGPRFRCGWR